MACRRGEDFGSPERLRKENAKAPVPVQSEPRL